MRRFASAVALASVLVVALWSAALAVGTVVLVSDGPPFGEPGGFADCAVGGPGFNYPSAEVEPYVAVNPANTANLIGVWQQDRWSNGGGHGLEAGFSTDGGSTWTNRTLPFDVCAAPGDPTVKIYPRASDPWVSIGPDGTAYTVSVSFDNTTGNNGVFASTSKDGGNSWSPAKKLIADTGLQFFNDKESVTADPTVSGTAYVVWDRLESPSPSPAADHHAVAFRGPTFFSKTTDGGQTWSTKLIFDPGQNNQTIGNIVVVDPRTGTLFDFFTLFLSTNLHGLKGGFNAVIKSTDGGATWSGPTIISRNESVGVSDPNNVNPRTNTRPAPIRTGDILPEPAIDPATGQLYLVWQDARFSSHDHDEVVIATSGDGGKTWSAPQRVNTPNGQPAFTPSVHIAADGKIGVIGVTYYQWRPTSEGSEPTDYLIKKFSAAQLAAGSIDSTVAATSVTDASPTAGPFNMLAAPFARGYFVGDYQGLTSVGSTFIPLYVQTNCSDLSCAALTSVIAPADRTPTENNSTDAYAGVGF